MSGGREKYLLIHRAISLMRSSDVEQADDNPQNMFGLFTRTTLDLQKTRYVVFLHYFL